MKAKNLSEWRQLVLERDNYTCQRCGSKENLLAHHTSYDEPLETANGLTLCSGCHGLEHSDLREWIHLMDTKCRQGSEIPDFLPTDSAYSSSYKLHYRGGPVTINLPKIYLEREARMAGLSLGKFIDQFKAECLYRDFGGIFIRFRKVT